MVFHMKKTTLMIPDSLFRKLKQRAAERGETMSSLVTEFLRRGLEGRSARTKLPPLPTFRAGEILVELNDREALDRVLNAQRDARLYGRNADL